MVDDHAKALFAHARFVLRDPVTAQDIVQDTLRPDAATNEAATGVDELPSGVQIGASTPSKRTGSRPWWPPLPMPVQSHSAGCPLGTPIGVVQEAARSLKGLGFSTLGALHETPPVRAGPGSLEHELMNMLDVPRSRRHESYRRQQSMVVRQREVKQRHRKARRIQEHLQPAPICWITAGRRAVRVMLRRRQTSEPAIHRLLVAEFGGPEEMQVMSAPGHRARRR